MNTMRTIAFVLLMGGMYSLFNANAQGDTLPENSIVRLADEHPVLFKRAVDNYLVCLRSENCGVVESALAHVVTLRAAFPDESFSELARQVQRLAAEGSTPGIRFKAALARLLFEDNRSADLRNLPSSADPDALFAELGVRLSRTLGQTLDGRR